MISAEDMNIDFWARRINHTNAAKTIYQGYDVGLLLSS